MANWFGTPKPATAENSHLHDVDAALSAWKHAVWQGKPAEDIALKKSALDVAKRDYIQNRGK